MRLPKPSLPRKTQFLKYNFWTHNMSPFLNKALQSHLGAYKVTEIWLYEVQVHAMVPWYCSTYSIDTNRLPFFIDVMSSLLVVGVLQTRWMPGAMGAVDGRMKGIYHKTAKTVSVNGSNPGRRIHRRYIQSRCDPLFIARQNIHVHFLILVCWSTPPATAVIKIVMALLYINEKGKWSVFLPMKAMLDQAS